MLIFTQKTTSLIPDHPFSQNKVFLIIIILQWNYSKTKDGLYFLPVYIEIFIGIASSLIYRQLKRKSPTSLIKDQKSPSADRVRASQDQDQVQKMFQLTPLFAP